MLTKKKRIRKSGHHKIHNFIDKMLQKSAFRKLTDYVDWRVRVGKGEKKESPVLLAPICIHLDLTTACNFDCAHCIDSYVKTKKEKFLPFDKFRSIVQYWVKKGLKSVIVMGGGEPVVYPQFEAAIDFLKSNKLQLGIVTNGSKMERIGKIAHLLNHRDWVRLSLDAGTDETFQKIHAPKTKANLDKILDNVRAIRRKYRQFQMGFSYLVISGEHGLDNGLVDNIGEIPRAVKKARDNGFSYFSIKPYISTKGHRPTHFDRRSLEQIKKQLEIARKYETKTFRIKESLNLTALLDGSNQDLVVHPKICHSQAFRLVVDPNGIYNCALWRGFEENHLIDLSAGIDSDFFKKLEQNIVQSVKNFDPTRKCSGTSCIYHELNWFVENLVRHSNERKRLKAVKDFSDYFL